MDSKARENFKEPAITPKQARRLTEKYLSEGGYGDDSEAKAAGDRLRAKPNVEDFRAIVKWKTRDRGRSRVRKNTDAEVLDAIRLALSADCPRSSIAVLKGLHGVDVPVASAVMTMLKPKSHTVIDFRALETLGYEGTYHSVTFYLDYLAYCKALAQKWGMTLRDVDRALWQWSKDHGKRAASNLR